MAQCISYCLVGAALLGSMIMSMLATKKSKNFRNFMALLDDNQAQVYKSVIKERMSIYVQGLVIGVILAILITFNSNLSKNNNVCLFVVIALGFNWGYYLLYPKSTYMLSHLNSAVQNDAWLRIYKEMKLRCHVGLLLGIVGYLLLGMGWCN
jgi:uncharacterized protein YacL